MIGEIEIKDGDIPEKNPNIVNDRAFNYLSPIYVYAEENSKGGLEKYTRKQIIELGISYPAILIESKERIYR